MRPIATLCLMILLLAGPARAEAPRVVATIAPLHSLVAGVMRGVGEPQLLVPGALSEHGYAMKPSDARALNDARLVVLIGGGLERFLEKPLAGLAERARVIEWMALPGVERLPFRGGDDHDHDDHPQQNDDPHLWLSPANAEVLVSRLAEELAALDPTNAAVYKANAADLRARLAALDAALASRLERLGGKPFLVFHDGYQYFEKRYGLTGIGAVTISAERPPGPRRIADLNARIARDGVGCVFREPQFDPKITKILAENTSAVIAVVDGLGASLPPGPDLYFRLLVDLADAFLACLGRN